MHDFLSPRRQKHLPTRIFLANSFLSNISLDGSHRDTKYRALAELYKNDEPSPDDTSADRSATSDNPDSTPHDDSPTPTRAALLRLNSAVVTTGKKKVRLKNLRRSNSLRSKQSKRSSSSSSSLSSNGLDHSAGSTDEESQDLNYPRRKTSGGVNRNASKTHRVGEMEIEEKENERASKKPRNRQRRSSSGSYTKPLRLDSISKRDRNFRTISGGSSDSHGHRGLHGEPLYSRADSASPGHTAQTFHSSSPPILELHGVEDEDTLQNPVEMTLTELFALSGEILDSHRGVITEKKEFMFTSNNTSHWPVAQSSYISKYKLEQVEEELVETRAVPRRNLFPAPPQSLLQRISARLSRINSAGSVGSSKSGRSESPVDYPGAQVHSAPVSSARRPWPWPLKTRAQLEPPRHQPIRPRRLSTVTSIHIETEAGALENLLGIKLTSDPEDELSYENLLVPLAWNIDHIGDLTPEEAKNLLNTGEISVVSKLMGPAHPNSFDENYAFSKVFRREPHESNRTRYYSITSQTSDRSNSQEPMVNGERQFAQDAYRPGILEDPEWETAVRRTNLYLDSYFSSIIANDLEPDRKKEALNEIFKGKFVYIQLTFSKFRSIKRDMQKACTDHAVRLDLAVVALSYVYFEKLVLRGFINKPNRKILACVCIVLAAKMNDLTKAEHGDLFDALQSQLRVERGEINAFEFAVTVALGFDLHVPVRYVRYHYDMLTKKNEELPSVYAIPLQEPVQIKQRLSLYTNPIRQISWTGLSRFANHRVNAARPSRRKP